MSASYSLSVPSDCFLLCSSFYLRAVGRKVLWSSACVCLCVCVSVCLCALCLSASYLKNGFMDHHQIWWVGAGGEPLEQVQFWCWSDSRCVSRITFPFPLTLMLATASAQVCVPLGHSSLYFITCVQNVRPEYALRFWVEHRRCAWFSAVPNTYITGKPD